MQQPSVNEWIVRCAQRLGGQWRTVDPALLEDVAVDLLREPRLRALEPEDAAVWWLRQGVLDTSGGASQPAPPDPAGA